MATHKPVIVDELCGELSVPEGDSRWYALHTKPQCEKKLADYMKRRDIWYFLALYDSERVYQHRKVVFTKPLFPGYIFACFGLNEKQMILSSGYIVRSIKVPDQLELLEDLNWIYQSRMQKAVIRQSEWLETGWQVEITNGPMKGMRGVVQSQTKLTEVSIQINILRQAVKVYVNPADVRVISAYAGSH